MIYDCRSWIRTSWLKSVAVRFLWKKGINNGKGLRDETSRQRGSVALTMRGSPSFVFPVLTFLTVGNSKKDQNWSERRAGAPASQKGLIEEMEERLWAQTEAWASGQKERSCTIPTVRAILCSVCLTCLICQELLLINYSIQLHNYSSNLP